MSAARAARSALPCAAALGLLAPFRSARAEALEKPHSEVVWKDVTARHGGVPVRRAKITTLNDLGFSNREVDNSQAVDKRYASSGQVYVKLVKEHDCVLADIVRAPEMHVHEKSPTIRAFTRGGPRDKLHFQPQEVRACIVNCGGLCPGLNGIIHHIVNTLEEQYGVKTIYGIRGGYRGLSVANDYPTMSSNALKMKEGGSEFGSLLLDSDATKDIHHLGGTVLGSARGGYSSKYDEENMISFLMEKEINQLYVIGGDGTHRGAHKLAAACVARGLEIAVAGIPKTIDNDVGLIDRSFGFDSAVDAAQDALRAAKIEAMGNMPNGIAIVKLMGRSAGFISVFSSISNGDVDLCLVPEVPIELEGEKSVLLHLQKVVERKGHAVVVIAEGAGEEILGMSTEVDAGGNKKLPNIGLFLKTKVQEHFKKIGKETKIVYIDPSYMIRAVPANSQDSYLCYLLASNAVHGAMAGYTSFSSGFVNNHSVLIPIPAITEASPRTLNVTGGRTWPRVVAITGQPH